MYLLINVLILITMRGLVDPTLASFTISFTASVCTQLTVAMRMVIDSNAVGASIERILVYCNLKQEKLDGLTGFYIRNG
ncbi:MAG: hypothetical protein V2I33_24615 [Kangiellaceae bacterium]|nr:hypothetical protein [Kangiellaceae bacterium]